MGSTPQFFTSVVDLLKLVGRTKKEGGGCHDKRGVAKIQSQIKLLENPPTALVDSPHQVAWWEKMLLGIPISCSKMEGHDVEVANTTCKEFAAGKDGYIVLGAEVTHVHEIKTKTGKNPGSKMGRLKFNDGTCEVEAVIFPEEWKEFNHILTEGNAVIVQGERSKKDGGFIVKKVWQAAFAANSTGDF